VERGTTQSESGGPASRPLEKRRGGFQCLELNALNSWMVGYRPWYRLRQSALPQRRKQTLNSPEGEPKGWTTRESEGEHIDKHATSKACCQHSGAVPRLASWAVGSLDPELSREAEREEARHGTKEV